MVHNSTQLVSMPNELPGKSQSREEQETSTSVPQLDKQNGATPVVAKLVEQGSQNPAMQLTRWIASFAIPGIGMFMEAYFIFSVGNVKPIWEEQFPQCWKVGLAQLSFCTLLLAAQVLSPRLLLSQPAAHHQRDPLQTRFSFSFP